MMQKPKNCTKSERPNAELRQNPNTGIQISDSFLAKLNGVWWNGKLCVQTQLKIYCYKPNVRLILLGLKYQTAICLVFGIWSFTVRI